MGPQIVAKPFPGARYGQSNQRLGISTFIWLLQNTVVASGKRQLPKRLFIKIYNVKHPAKIRTSRYIFGTRGFSYVFKTIDFVKEFIVYSVRLWYEVCMESIMMA